MDKQTESMEEKTEETVLPEEPEKGPEKKPSEETTKTELLSETEESTDKEGITEAESGETEVIPEEEKPEEPTEKPSNPEAELSPEEREDLIARERRRKRREAAQRKPLLARIGKKRILAVILAIIALIAGFGAYKAVNRGWKKITLTVADGTENKARYSIRTKTKTLLEAMDEMEGLTCAGTTDSMGFLILEVNGVKAGTDSSKEFWLIYRNGLATSESADQIITKDGDRYRLERTAAN